MGRRTAIIGLAGFAASTALLAPFAPATAATSVFATRPDDPSAVTVGATGDGRADDSAAIQAGHRPAVGTGALAASSSCRRAAIGSRARSSSGRACACSASGRRGRCSLLGDRTPGFQDGVATMVIFAGRGVEPPPPASRASRRSRRRQRAVQRRHRRRQSGHVLFGDEQRRHRDRPGQRRRRGDPLPCRPARLSAATWTSDLGTALRRRLQVGNYGGPALPRRTLRHRHREAVARLAVHAGRQHVRRPARRRRSASTRPG